jgi:hypothetical protein
MGDKPPPVLLAMVICDLIIRDELTKKLTMVGVFSAIHGKQLPVVLGGGMHLYAALTDGRGEYDSALTIRHLESEKQIFQARGPFAFKHPQQVVEINMKLPKLVFPAWGRYEISLSADGEPLGSRTFVLRPIRAVPPPSGGPSAPSGPSEAPGPSEPPESDVPDDASD